MLRVSCILLRLHPPIDGFRYLVLCGISELYYAENINDALLACSTLSKSSPEAMATIYRFANALDKAPFYEPFNTTGFSPHGDVFSCKSDKKHGIRRRIVSNIYSMTNVAKSEQYIDSCSDLLTERLGQFAKSGEPCDLGEWLHW